MVGEKRAFNPTEGPKSLRPEKSTSHDPAKADFRQSPIGSEGSAAMDISEREKLPSYPGLPERVKRPGLLERIRPGLLDMMKIERDPTKEKAAVLSKLPEKFRDIEKARNSAAFDTYISSENFASITSQFVQDAERLEKWASKRRKTLRIDDWEYEGVIKGDYPEKRDVYYKNKGSYDKQRAAWGATHDFLGRLERKLRDWQEVQ